MTENYSQKYLEQYEKAEAIIENKLIEKEKWESLAHKITANMDGERVKSSGNKDPMGMALDNCLDVINEISSCVARWAYVQKNVTQTLEGLENVIEYKMLHMRYIQYIPLADIADYFGKEYSWATTTHGRALKSVQRILNARNNA